MQIKLITKIILFQLIISGIFVISLSTTQAPQIISIEESIITPTEDSSSARLSTVSYDNATVISDGYGGSWGWNTETSHHPSIAVDSSGNLHVVWEDFTPGIWGGGPLDSEIMYANRTSAGWSNITVISDGFGGVWGWNTNYSYFPSITIDGSGNLHVVWEDNTPGIWSGGPLDSEIMYVNRTSAGWSNATVISDGFGGNYWNTELSSSPSIAVDSSGNLHVVWTDSTPGVWGGGYVLFDSEIMYVNRTSAGWSNITVISDGYGGEWGWNTGNSYDPSITIDGSGNLHVIWTDLTPGIWGSDTEIMYVTRTSAGWSNITVISDGYGGEWGWNNGSSYAPSIAVDSSDYLHVVWTDGTPGVWGGGILDSEIMYVNRNSTGWSNVTVISDGYGGEWGWNTGKSVNPIITVDGLGNLYVVWEDISDGIWKDGDSDYEIMYVNCINGMWSNTTVISDGYGGEWGWNTEGSYSPSITIDGSGNLHVVWSDDTPGIWGSNRQIMYTKITISQSVDFIAGSGGGDDDDDDDGSAVTIPFGNFYLIAIAIGIISLVVYNKRKF